MRLPLGLIAILLFSAAPSSAQGVWAQQLDPYMTTPCLAGDTAISADGNILVVGEQQPSCPEFPTGGAFVFGRVNGRWTQIATLVPSGVIGTGEGLGFGVAISRDGNYIALGSVGDNGLIGATWVFVRSGNTWVQQAKLVASPPTLRGRQGAAVAFSADASTLVVGAPDDTGYGGAVWVFNRSGQSWTQTAKLAAAPGDTFQMGFSVAISADGNTAVAGDPSVNSNAGAVVVFTRSGSAWSSGVKLKAGGAIGAPWLGYRVDISADGNTVIAGGANDNGGVGAAWVFSRSGGTWSQQTKLVGSGSAGVAYLGTRVALSPDGNSAVLSASGDSPTVVGANPRGAMFLFSRSNGIWTQTGGKLVDTSATADTKQGSWFSFSADTKTLVVGGYIGNSLKPEFRSYVYGLPASTTLVLPSAVYGDPVPIQATVRSLSGSGIPTGTVRFRNGGVDLGSSSLVNGIASLTIPLLPAGAYPNLTAQYYGDSVYVPSVSATPSPLVIQKAATTIGAPAVISGALVFGEAVQLQAVVSGRQTPPTGVVNFFDYGSLIAVAPLDGSGKAVLSTSNLGAGNRSITASFSGDSNYLDSASSALSVTIAPTAASATVIPSPANAVFGQTVTFTASFGSVLDAPVGGAGVTTSFVDSADGGAVLCVDVPVVNNQAACVPSKPLSVGSHVVSIATLRGDARYRLGTVTSATLAVTRAATTTTVSGAAVVPEGEGLFTARVQVVLPGVSTLTGGVGFTVNGSPIADCQTLPLSAAGIASCAVSCPVGRCLVGASYEGDSFTQSSADSMTATITANPGGPSVWNGASYLRAPLAGDEIVAIFGAGLATATASAADLPWPTSLAGASVQVRFASGASLPALLTFVSPGQINCILPSPIARGGAVIEINNGAGNVARTATNFAAVAPGLFSADASGRGVAAANVQRVGSDGTNSVGVAAAYDSASGAFVPVPIQVDSSDQVYVTFYGTGIRGASAPANVSVTIGSAPVPVLYSGPTPGYPGLDQVNVGPLPPNLRGSGTVDVKLNLAGQQANSVQLSIQ